MISFVVRLVVVVTPVIVGEDIVGLVITLFVKVCDPVKVATVASMATVNVFEDPDVSIPVPPAMVSVSESRSIDSAPPESP